MPLVNTKTFFKFPIIAALWKKYAIMGGPVHDIITCNNFLIKPQKLMIQTNIFFRLYSDHVYFCKQIYTEIPVKSKNSD